MCWWDDSAPHECFCTCRREKFRATILSLVLVSAACGVLTGVRGGLFTVAMSKLNVRLRKSLFHSLLMVGTRVLGAVVVVELGGVVPAL